MRTPVRYHADVEGQSVGVLHPAHQPLAFLIATALILVAVIAPVVRKRRVEVAG